MSLSYVIIHYGPCESFHTFSHKPQKLKGMRDRLSRLGFRVDIRPVDVINLCLIEMSGHEVFRCNIKNLHFNKPWSCDPVCKRAVLAVVESSKKFLRSQSFIWVRTFVLEQILKRTEYDPKDYWVDHFDLEPFDIKCCINCCGLLVKKREEISCESCESNEGFIGFNS